MIGKPVALIQIPNQRLFGIRPAARYLGVCVDTLRRYSGQGWIPAYELEGRRVFRLEDLDAFVEALPEYVSSARPGQERR